MYNYGYIEFYTYNSVALREAKNTPAISDSRRKGVNPIIQSKRATCHCGLRGKIRVWEELGEFAPAIAVAELQVLYLANKQRQKRQSNESRRGQ